MESALIALVIFVVVVLIVGAVAYILSLAVAKVVPDGTIVQIVKMIIWLVAILIIVIYGLIPLIHALPSPG